MNPFKPGFARGDHFCNRIQEIASLKNNMLSGIHTVVYAPRRYGKSSLAQVLMEHLGDKMVCIYVDLLKPTSAEDVASAIYRKIVNALGAKAVDRSSVAAKIASFFKRIRLSLEFNPVTSFPEFNISLGNDSAEIHLESVVSSLDEYCKATNSKACLILDEFQEICDLKDSKKIEAILRGGMQSVENISFLMMGSRRRILKDMFEDKSRPFYKSAFVMQLEKIPANEFSAFLVKHFEDAGSSLDLTDSEQIVEFCDSYAYYVQKLAMLYFDLKQQGVSLDEVKHRLVAMEAMDFEDIYVSLTNHQKRLLKAVAKSKPLNLFAASFLFENRLGSQGGTQSSLVKLKKLDLVEQQKEGWRVVDPIFEKWLLED